jgi:RNA polymerase sigma-70 factor (ECF subfamily)
MARRDRTTIGGQKEAFQTTQWTQILNVRTTDADRRRGAMGIILGQYWKPVYCHLRRKGYDNEAAKDLTQGFFTEIALGGDLIQKAEQTKGRFRTFLLTALERYVVSRLRAATAEKRQPRKGLVSLDGIEAPGIPEPASGATPEGAFHYAWASSLVDQVIAEVEAACRRGGMTKHWAVFHRTVVRPSLEGAEAPTLRELCDELGIASEAKASNMNVTVKRRFQAALRRQVRQYVDADEQVDQEIRELMEILSHGGAGA